MDSEARMAPEPSSTEMRDLVQRFGLAGVIFVTSFVLAFVWGITFFQTYVRLEDSLHAALSKAWPASGIAAGFVFAWSFSTWLRVPRSPCGSCGSNDWHDAHCATLGRHRLIALGVLGPMWIAGMLLAGPDTIIADTASGLAGYWAVGMVYLAARVTVFHPSRTRRSQE